MRNGSRHRGHVLEEGRLTIGDFERLGPGAKRWALQREFKQFVDKSPLQPAGPRNRLQYLARAALAP